MTIMYSTECNTCITEVISCIMYNQLTIDTSLVNKYINVELASTMVLVFFTIFLFILIPNNNEFIIIGITGHKRSGKDTVGKYLIDNYGFVRVAYADALKEACKIIFSLSDEQLYGDELKDVKDEYLKYTPREIMQIVGTDLIRNQLPLIFTNMPKDIWIRAVDKQIKKLHKCGYTRFVITDVRFPDEHDFITKYNGKIWKVIRSTIMKDIISHTPEHESETMIDKFKCNAEFINNGTLQDLYKTVDKELDTFFN